MKQKKKVVSKQELIDTCRSLDDMGDDQVRRYRDALAEKASGVSEGWYIAKFIGIFGAPSIALGPFASKELAEEALKMGLS